jgi:protein TonB
MFEQSILIDHTGARKTGAFAASLTAQILLGGVLLLAPLIYQEALPIVRFSTLVAMPVLPPAPEPPRTADVPTAQSSGLSAPAPFRPRPRFSVVEMRGNTVIDIDAPTLTIAPTDPTGILSTSVPTIPLVDRPPQPLAPKPIASESDKPLSVSSGVQAAKLIRQVVPTYPPLAIRMRASGTVHLLGIIGKDGKIKNLQVLNGHPLLTQAALDAVRQWIYSPTILSGNPVEVEAPIDVIFTLSR